MRHMRIPVLLSTVLLVNVILAGCGDPPIAPAKTTGESIPAPAAPKPPANSAGEMKGEATPKTDAQASPVEPVKPEPAKSEPAKAEPAKAEPAKSAAVSKEVYSPRPAASTSSPADRKAVSWYFMKKKKGEVPNFPADIKSYKPHYKAAWVGTGKKVYLTLDMGGDLIDVDRMIATLRDNEVKVTFFVTGYNLKSHKSVIKRLEEEGHLVMNHSITHRDFTTLSDDQVRKEFADFEQLYRDITDKEPQKYFRFPYGKYSNHLLDLVTELGYTSVFWSTAMKDWEPRKNGADDAYNDIINNLHDGNIILMHQASKENMDALDRILKQIKEEGYSFGLVTEF